MSNKKIVNYTYVLISAFFVSYPPLISLISFGVDGIFKYFASDTFYYIGIANNSSWSPLFSFDGEYPTNGFHPLFQVYLKAIFNIFFENNIEKQIVFIYFNSIILLAASSILISYSLIKLGYSKVLTVIAVVPGFFHIFFSDLSQQGNFWYFNNGMESSFSIFFFSIFFYLFLKKGFSKVNNKYVVDSTLIFLVTTLIIFSRLDDIFLYLVIVFYFLFEIKNTDKKKYLYFIISTPFLLVVLYCLINLSYAGSLLPSSGSSKFDISIYYNMMSFFNLIFPAGEIFSSNNWEVWVKTSARISFVILPMFLSIFYIVYFSQNRLTFKNQIFPKLLFYLSLYVIIKSLYNLIFVWVWHQGYWYFSINVIVFNLIILFFLNQFIQCINFNKFNFKILNNNNSKNIINGLIFLTIVFVILIIFDSFKNNITEKETYLLGLSKLRFYSVLFFIFISMFIVIYLISLKKIIKINYLYKSIFLLLFLFVISNSYINSKQYWDNDLKNKPFVKNSEKINDDLLKIESKLNNKLKIVSYDDGIINTYLNYNVMSGLGFALDVDAIKEKNKGKLLDIAYERGYKYITSLNYIAYIDEPVGSNVNKYLKRTFWLSDHERQKYNFTLVYRDKESDFNLIRIDKIK